MSESCDYQRLQRSRAEEEMGAPQVAASSKLKVEVDKEAKEKAQGDEMEGEAQQSSTHLNVSGFLVNHFCP